MTGPDLSDQVWALQALTGFLEEILKDTELERQLKARPVELEIVWILPRGTMPVARAAPLPGRLDRLFGKPVIEPGGPGVDRPYLAVRPVKPRRAGTFEIRDGVSQVFREMDRHDPLTGDQAE